MLKIGSHVSLSGKQMLVGSIEQALTYNSNAFMIYTGAPQNTKRKDLSELRIEEFKDLLKVNKISAQDVVVHAPYIINLGNTKNPSTFELAVTFLRSEIERTSAIGSRFLVLHPGAHVEMGEEAGLNQIVRGLNEVLTKEQDVIICLETMAGKGTELGKTFEQLGFIIDNVDFPEKLGVCLDTCHIHDAGYDLSDIDTILNDFDKYIGLDKLEVIHLNDSKNIKGAKKDRHENIGYGEIGFENLMNFVYHDKLKDIVKILETPYIDKKTAPYKEEIEMIRNKSFKDWRPKNEA